MITNRDAQHVLARGQAENAMPTLIDHALATYPFEAGPWKHGKLWAQFA